MPSRARNVSHLVSARASSARKAPVAPPPRPNHLLLEEANLIKPGPIDYELYIAPKPVTAHLKQSQVGAVIGVVSMVQCLYTEVAQGELLEQTASCMPASSRFPALIRAFKCIHSVFSRN